MKRSSGGRKSKAKSASTTPTPYKRFGDLHFPCPSCGHKQTLGLGADFSGSSRSGSLPSRQAAKPASCPTDSSSLPPSPLPQEAPGSGSSCSSIGSGPSTMPSMKKEGDRISAYSGEHRLRCNQCSKLFTNKTLDGKNCSCGGSAWFLTRPTLVEWIGLKLGWIEPAKPPGMIVLPMPPGGRKADMQAAFAALEEQKNGNLTA